MRRIVIDFHDKPEGGSQFDVCFEGADITNELHASTVNLINALVLNLNAETVKV